MTITIGSAIKLEVKTAAETVDDLNLRLLLWGDAGCGKTTLAATAPGRKLWLNIGNQETASIIGDAPDTQIVDLETLDSAQIVKGMQNKSLFGLQEALDSGELEFDTLVVDHATDLVDHCLRYGVTQVTTRGGIAPTYEEPQLAGYGRRNSEAIKCIRNLLRFATKNKKNLIVICHEGSPDTDKDGIVLSISISLGGQVNSKMPANFSEVWAMFDLGNKRMIAVRPTRKRKPMKSRMFKGKVPEFEWKFNADIPWDHKSNDGHRLSDWMSAWIADGGKRQELPK